MVLLATGFGLGKSPIAPGTLGALAGAAIVLVMSALGLIWQILLTAGMVLAAIPVCGEAEKHFSRKDDGRIVADECFTFSLCVLGLPWQEYPWLLALAFVTNRVLDIVKPPPARRAQTMHGGLGIVMDDVISSLYALGANHAIYFFWDIVLKK